MSFWDELDSAFTVLGKAASPILVGVGAAQSASYDLESCTRNKYASMYQHGMTAEQQMSLRTQAEAQCRREDPGAVMTQVGLGIGQAVQPQYAGAPGMYPIPNGSPYMPGYGVPQPPAKEKSPWPMVLIGAGAVIAGLVVVKAVSK